MNGKEMNAKCSDSSRLLRCVQMTLSRTYRDICMYVCRYIHALLMHTYTPTHTDTHLHTFTHIL